jgi:hypothetical protein
MSGGSYDYLCRRVAEGELDAFSRWAGALAEDLKSLSQSIRSGEVTVWDGAERQHYPYPSSELSADAVDDVRRNVVAVAARIAALQVEVRALEDVCHDVEWWQSGDYGPDQATDACVAFVALQRGQR